MVKQEVLTALDAVRGRYISGQELAAQLGVSRTAVWKAVAALRRDGIPIKKSHPAKRKHGFAPAFASYLLSCATSKSSNPG